MAVVTYVTTRYRKRDENHARSAADFNTASASIKPGLIAAGIVSAWTWSATLLESSTAVYLYGVSGAWWYAAGAVVQVLLFSMMAVKLKQNASGAVTFLEIVQFRYGGGKPHHILYLCFALVTNILVSSMLILGGASVVSTLTGVNVFAANYLIPISVAIYVYSGGLRATLFADWSHTSALMIIILYFCFAFYTPGLSDLCGSPTIMWELLRNASAVAPVEGNAGGSYTTLSSTPGLVFGIVNLVGNFGTIFLDQTYFQRGIASRPESAVKGFFIGGLGT